jgi:hypothetical protein
MGPRRDGAARHGGTLDSSVVPDFPPTYGEILNGDYGCLDAVAQHTQTNGDQVQLWSCTGRSNQLWSYNQSTGQIVNYSDGKCLDANSQALGNGDKVQVWSCNGQDQQSWCFADWIAQVDGYNGCSPDADTSIVNFADYYCLDANGHSIGNGDKVELYSCNGGGNQGWFP